MFLTLHLCWRPLGVSGAKIAGVCSDPIALFERPQWGLWSLSWHVGPKRGTHMLHYYSLILFVCRVSTYSGILRVWNSPVGTEYCGKTSFVRQGGHFYDSKRVLKTSIIWPRLAGRPLKTLSLVGGVQN